MTIRPLTPADLPLIRSWMQGTPEAPVWSDADILRLAEPTASLELRVRSGWMAVAEDSEAAGFIVASALRIFPELVAECEIEFVMTLPSYRRTGVARALAEAVLAWARELAAEEVRLEVRASNEAAQRLYEGCGFVISGRRPGYYAGPTEDAVLMLWRRESGG
jgi:[ribosomal protein S18]-alanine N-acetyltransferase